MYGPGEAALSLTTEHGASYDEDQTKEVFEAQKAKTLCRGNGTRGAECEVEEGNLAPQVVLFVAQFISGVGSSLYYTLGVSYMDDNIKKSKTPALVSEYLLQLIGAFYHSCHCSSTLRCFIFPENAWTSDRLYVGVVLLEAVYFPINDTNHHEQRSSMVGSLVVGMASPRITSGILRNFHGYVSETATESCY